MRNNMKRILSLILCITMLMGVMPTSAFATEMVDPSGMVSVQEYTDSGPVPEEEALEPADEVLDDGSSGENNGLNEGDNELSDTDGLDPENEETGDLVLDDNPADGIAGESVEPSDAPISSEPLDDNNAVSKTEPDTTIGASGELKEEIEEQHWIQKYQEWALSQQVSTFALRRSASTFATRSSGSSAEFAYIRWGSGGEDDKVKFGNTAWINSPLPKIYLDGEIAFCGEWNGEEPSGSYIQSGEGSDRVIKQILANYDQSGQSDADYAAAQIAIWARIMGTEVETLGTCPADSSWDEIINGDADYSNLKYNYIEWSGGTQDLITYNTEEEPDLPDLPDIPTEEEYPADSYEIIVETDTQTETEVRNRKSYEYSDAIGQITIRKHDQDGESLDDALFNIRVDFTDGSFIEVENWEVDNGARLFTWTHPEDNHDDATVTVREVKAPRYYTMDPTPQVAVVSPTFTRVTHVETWTVTIVTETTSATVIEIESGDVVAESESSASAETESEPQVEEFTDFIEGDRETTLTFVNTRITGNIEVLKRDANTGTPLAGASVHLWGKDLGDAEKIDLTRVTGADGIAYFDDLPPGSYVIQETQAPFGYNLNNEQQTVALQSGETIRKEIHNYRKDGLIIKKVDVDGKPLSGAVFELRRGSGEVLLRDTTNENGVIFRDYLSEDHYVIEEIQAPYTHLIDETPIKEIFIYESDDNKQYTVTFVNLEKPKLLIRKIDADTGAPLAGAVLRVAERGSKEYTDVTTDENGEALLENLNVNWYEVTELRAPTGYVTEDTHYDIELVAQETATLVVKNRSKPNLTIEKIDSVTKEPLQGVVFEVAIKNGKSLGEFTTDVDGKIVLSDVEPGETYLITEVKALEGYHIDEKTKEITLDENEDKVVPFTNTPQNPIIIKKLDDITGDPIEDTVFSVTKVNGEFVGEYTTGKHGYATVAGIDPGFYVIREVRANSKYILSNEAKTVQLKADEPAIVEFYNTPKTGLQIIKTDYVTGKPLEGVEFTVTELNGALIGNYETDKDGLITIEDQAEKWVRVVETKPLAGYKPDSEPRVVELLAGTLTLVEYENKPYPVLEITKVDADTSEPLKGVKLGVYDSRKREIGTFTTNADGKVVLSGMDGDQTLYIKELETLAGYQLKTDYVAAKLEWGKKTEVVIENEIKPLSVTVKKTGNHEVISGDIMRYDFYDIANTSEIMLDEFYWHDALPTDAVRLGHVQTGVWSHTLKFDITYKTNRSRIYEVAESGLHSNVSYDIDLSAEALDLRRGEYVTDIRFEFEDVPAGFHDITGPSVYVTTMADLTTGYRIINRTDVGGCKNDTWAVDKDTWITVVWAKERGCLPKTGV